MQEEFKEYSDFLEHHDALLPFDQKKCYFIKESLLLDYYSKHLDNLPFTSLYGCNFYTLTTSHLVEVASWIKENLWAKLKHMVTVTLVDHF